MIRKVLAAAGLCVLVAGELAAQSTGTPVFLAPYRSFERTEFGGSLSDPGRGLAVEGFYRFGDGRYDIGLRAGVADRGVNATQFLVGVDFRTRVIDHTEDFPLDGAFTAGIGGAFGDGPSSVYLPFGLSLGRRIELEDSKTAFVPYFHPVLAPRLGGGDGDLLFALGLGVDISLSRRFDIRVSGALGDYDGVAVSFAVVR